MVCLGFEPGTAGWWALTNPLNYSGPLNCKNCSGSIQVQPNPAAGDQP